MRPSGDDDIDLMISRIYYDERCPQQFHSCRPPSVALQEESYRTNFEPEYCYLVQRLFAARCKDALRLGNDALDFHRIRFPPFDCGLSRSAYYQHHMSISPKPCQDYQNHV